MTKDYYRILGVLDDAEDVVIRAAYKALAQRYHPDKWTGDKEVANRRMQEINEAYGVLSDSAKRKQYDATWTNGNYQENFSEEEDELLTSIEDDWRKVLDYLPDLIQISANLARISKALEYAYKVTLIESKEFNNRFKLAESFENSFLRKYFGTNKKIIKYARELIMSGNKSAARELNQAVLLLGSNIDPEIIIANIDSKFNISTEISAEKQAFERAKDFAKSLLLNKTSREAVHMITLLGGDVNKQTNFFKSSYKVTFRNSYKELNEEEFIQFAIQIANEIMPNS